MNSEANDNQEPMQEAVLMSRALYAQVREALRDACLTYAVHGDQPPQKWLDALAAMNGEK